MTREDWSKDLKVVDEIVCKSGEALRVLDNEGNTKTATLRMIYWLSVAVWHLLTDKIRGLDNDNRNC